MTNEEREIALYCLKVSSDYHSEVCEECVKYPNCDHTIQDDVTETIIKALEQTRWIPVSERQPEGEGWYLTSLGDKTYGGVDVDMYCKGWVKYGTHVIAWKPLPQPYKESEDAE